MIELLEKFLSNPIIIFIGFIGAIASIIAIPLAIYFYRRGNKKRGLTYKINPVRTQIVKAGTASQLSVMHNGRVMTGDIMAAHIAIWNQGRKSIRQTDMLRPLVIETEKDVPILEASILKTNRDIIEFRLDESRCDQGKLEVFWTILEPQDGGIVQMIYEGTPDLQITAHATPEGQRKIIDGSKVSPIRNGNERAIYRWSFPMMVVVSIVYIANVVTAIRQGKNPIWGYLPLILQIILLITVVGVILWMQWRLRQARPPFEC